MRFSSNLGEVGRFRLKKIVELARVIALTLFHRLRTGARILYYPPAGGGKVPVYRDLLLLNVLRPFFRSTVFHFQASGLTDFYAECRSRLVQALYRRAYFGADMGIKVSHNTRIDCELLQVRNVITIYNAVEDPIAAPDRNARSERCRLLYVGSLIESKGIMVLLAAFADLRRRHPSLELHLVGAFKDDVFERRVEDAIRQSDLGLAVTLHGECIGVEKAHLYATADIFCFPTFYENETFGLVVAEAMSYELPVVATDWSGVPEVIRDQHTGFLVPVRDEQQLALRLEELIVDPDLRRRFGRNGRARYLEHFAMSDYHAKVERALCNTFLPIG